MIWQKCPICFGVGTVPQGFYSGGTIGTSTTAEQCRSCAGKGILLAPGNPPYPPYTPAPNPCSDRWNWNFPARMYCCTEDK